MFSPSAQTRSTRQEGHCVFPRKKAVWKIVSPAIAHKPEVGGALYDLLA
jgi:hypothetical protein